MEVTTDTIPAPKAPLPCGIRKLKTSRGRLTGYRAFVETRGPCGVRWELTGDGTTEAEAKAALAKNMLEAVRDMGCTYVLRDLHEPAIWVVEILPDGYWHYMIRREDPVRPGQYTYLGMSSGGYRTYDEAVAAVRAHWWQNNMEGLTRALWLAARAMVSFVCPSCHSVSESSVPLRCQNPSCGREVPA